MDFETKLVGTHLPTISFQNIYFRTCEKFRYRIGEPWTPVTAPPGPWVFNFEIEFMESRTF
jgi:hypothetical protein